MLLQVTMNGLMLGLTYVLIAIGFSFIFGIARIFNFAHGELYMLGGWLVVIIFGVWGLNYGLALLGAALCIGLLGIAMDRIFFQPLRGQVIPPLVVALGLQLLISAVALIIFGEKDVSISSPFPGVTTLGNLTMANERLFVILISAVLIAALFLFMRYTKLGLAVRAVPQNMEAATLQGVNINKVCRIAFFIGAIMAALAGGLLAPVFYVNSFQGQWAVFKAIIIVGVGGAGTLGGTIIAGLMIGLVEAFSFQFFGSAVSEIIGFAFIIVILLIRPQGLLGHEST
jgi:branched-chain amino acid transport system permease protein